MGDAPPLLRKIQLDTLDDLRHLYGNLVRLAREKIDIHVPPRLGGASTTTTPATTTAAAATPSRGPSSGRGTGTGRKSAKGGARARARARASAGRATGGGGGDGDGDDDGGGDGDGAGGTGFTVGDGVGGTVEQGEDDGPHLQLREDMQRKGLEQGEVDDPLRNRVNELVMQFITSIFDLAAPSISINGLDALPIPSSSSSTIPIPGSVQPNQPEAKTELRPAPKSIIDILKPNDMDEYEHYDRALHARLQSLYADIETYTVRLAQQRREAPVRALRRYDKALNLEMDRDSKLLDAIVREGEEERKRRGLPPDVSATAGGIAAGGVEEGREGTLDSGKVEGRMEGVEMETGTVCETGVQVQGLQNRHSEVVSDWERSMGVMGVLAKGLPATAHKLERAKAALEYIEVKERKRKRVAE